MLNDLRPGAIVDGFTLDAQVHGGAQGALFRVTKPGLTLPLVMKLPRTGRHEPSGTIVAHETEAMIVPTLTGPHVPAFVAVGDLAQTPYLVTEWIPGPTLDGRLAAGPMAPADVIQCGAAIADALHSLHQQGVVHLDVKPSNVIFRDDGKAVLLDFGFACHARLPDLLAEETRAAAGSAPYVSPEQLLGVRGDRRSDLFALGVVLYEAVTGRFPFGEPDADVRNRFWIDPVPPSALVPEVAPWLQEIILRCLETRPELRYQTAAHVAFDLRHPDQVPLTARATKARRSGLIAHVRRFLRARAEHGARLRSPAPLLTQAPIVLAAVDTTQLDDERHPALRRALSQFLSPSTEFRLICLTVISPGDASSELEHLVRLRHWVSPLGLPMQRLSLHAVPAGDPGDAIVELAAHNNVDLVVIGAPSGGGREWSRSVASTVTARARCSIHVVRVPKR